MTEPTDAELDELRQANSGKLNFVTLSEFRTIARAVLKKWGTPQPVVREPLTRQQLREAFHKDTGCTLGGDIDLAERVCGVVERAHGITTTGRKDAP